MAILLDMNRMHVPVLAGELIDLTAPARGRDRGRLHLRRGRSRAPGRGPARLDGHARLHRSRPRRRGALRGAGARGRPARRASCAWTTPRGSRCCARRACRRTWSTSTSGISLDAGGRARARLLLLLRRAARHAHGPGPGARRARDRERLGRAPAGAALPPLRRGPATRAGSRARSCAAASARRFETTGELVAAIEAALPAAVRRSFGGGHPAKRVFQAIRIAVNDELDSLDRALPLAWDAAAARTAGWPRSPSTRSRTGA